MKMLSLFSGVGAFEAALDNIGIDFELVGYCEIDKYASKSYAAIHGVPESMNYGDITKIDEKKLPKDIDLITYGFPCQDISLAGKQKGILNSDVIKLLGDMGFADSEIANIAKWISKGEHTDDEIRHYLFDEYGLGGWECDTLIANGINESTRSGLFFQALRIIEETKPKIAIAENVKNLVGKKFKEQFEIVLSSLEQAGYNNYWKVLNAKDYGIPQNRERVFIVSIRKDIDTGVFEFPEPYELKLRLKDLLEDEVDEKFYLNNTGTLGIINALTDGRGHKPSILSKDTEFAPTIDTKVGDQTHRSPYIEVKTNNSKENHCVVTSEPFIVRSVGRNPENPSDRTTGCPTEQRLEPNSQGICNTLTTVQKDNFVCEPTFVNGDVCKTIRTGGHGSVDRHSWDMVEHNLRIRKLTPKECFRLMGFNDEDFEKAASVNSNTQLYKQAGNSIVVDVLEELFCMMFDEDGELYV